MSGTQALSRTLLSLAVLIPLLFVACRDHDPAGPETNEIRLQFLTNPGSIGEYVDTLTQVPDSIISLYAFNKANYRHVDSAVLMVLLATPRGIYPSPIPGITYLYDHTNNQIIQNSRIENRGPEARWMNSKNIWDDLPDGNLTLGVTLQGAIYDAFLILY